MLALALLFGLAACDSTSPGGDDASEAEAQELAAELSSQLTQDLGLSADQQQGMRGAMDRRGFEDPGFLWGLAAELQASLSDEQKQQLFDLAAQLREAGPGGRPGEGFGRPGRRPGGPGLGERGPGEGGPGCLDDLLTEEQRAALDALRETRRAEIQALREAVRNGDLTREAFAEQRRALAEAARAELDALLTDEQREALESCRAERQAEREAEREAHREAVRAAMHEALGVTDEQIAALDALVESQQAEREALREQIEAGTLDRDGVRAALEALRAARDEALQQILDAVQYEIVQIHDALAVVLRHRMARRGPGPGGADRRDG